MLAHLKIDHQLEDCLGPADTTINNNNNKTSSNQEKVTIDVIITNIVFNIRIREVVKKTVFLGMIPKPADPFPPHRHLKGKKIEFRPNLGIKM